MGGVGRLLTNPRTLAALWATVVEAIIHTSFESTLPLIVSTTFGWSSIGAGVIFLPIALPNFLGPVIGAIGDRYGPKWLTSCGFLVLTPLLLCFQFVTENTIEHQVLLYSLLTGVGFCMACIMGPLMAEITWSIQGDVSDSAVVPYAMAYGLYNAAFSIGGIIGPIIGGLVRDRVGMWAVGVIFGTTTACTSIACALFMGGPLRKRGMAPSPTLE
ncbi:hypothetical protein K4F52_002903 [Lecanicillium sp. MT-2017a]|nr:hypothetical protein K4F52_002903 [Lecanicillium sp. MT-2017a]